MHSQSFLESGGKMVEESEKRFEALMNKLFDTPPKSKPSSDNTSGHGGRVLSGRKRPHSSLVGMNFVGNALGETGSSMMGSGTSAQAALCRPWDRDDLFRRLSTFKSMTWFAKPQVVSPMECARRGWVNVDIDTIACASCDTRILFSTPSSWTQQQVEKAAKVFSLKLENGHKLLCPWINNACTEELAQFPVVSRASLIDDYKKRILSLSQLIALPVICPAAINNVKSSLLEQFVGDTLTSGDLPLEKSRTELRGDALKSISSISYTQAQKLISLFGWEPHMLPYKVDLKDGQDQSTKDANVTVTTGQKQKVNVYSLCASEGSDLSSEHQLDPSSIVLDCKLCGASVGLWSFSTIPRPLEFLRIVGFTEVTGESTSIHDEVGTEEGSSGCQTHTRSREGITNTVTTASTSLGFTIAGGPPPAMLNYGATISLPIIGHNLRARFPTETGNSPVSDHHRYDTEEHICSTPESSTPSGKGGGTENNSEKVFEAENYGQGSSYPGVDMRLPSPDKTVGFDPIKQHRHFCPWIMSNGKFTPGWQQTLSALEGHKELSNAPSSTLIEVDDPVASVQMLFSSPSEKRAKLANV